MLMIEERWQSAVGASGYHISTRGNLLRWWGGIEEDVEGYVGPEGHLFVDLMIETNTYNYETGTWVRAPQAYLVWQLMIRTWFSNWRREFEIVHIDGDLTNNSIENLRAQVLDNRTGMMRIVGIRDDGYLYAFDKRQRGRVEIIETGEICMGVKDAAMRIGGNHSNISHVLAGRLDTHMGYHFRWVE